MDNLSETMFKDGVGRVDTYTMGFQKRCDALRRFGALRGYESGSNASMKTAR